MSSSVKKEFQYTKATSTVIWFYQKSRSSSKWKFSISLMIAIPLKIIYNWDRACLSNTLLYSATTLSLTPSDRSSYFTMLNSSATCLRYIVFLTRDNRKANITPCSDMFGVNG